MAQEQLTDGSPDGAVMGRTDDLLGFFGLATSVAQQSAGTNAPAIDPSVSGSALVASIHSIAIAAASLANANAATLTNLGLQA